MSRLFFGVTREPMNNPTYIPNSIINDPTVTPEELGYLARLSCFRLPEPPTSEEVVALEERARFELIRVRTERET